MTRSLDATAWEAKAAEIRAVIARRRFYDATKAALIAVLEGQSYRQAAEAHGVRWRDLHRAARTVPGLREAHLRAWQRSWGQTVPSVWRQHLQGVEE